MDGECACTASVQTLASSDTVIAHGNCNSTADSTLLQFSNLLPQNYLLEVDVRCSKGSFDFYNAFVDGWLPADHQTNFVSEEYDDTVPVRTNTISPVKAKDS